MLADYLGIKNQSAISRYNKKKLLLMKKGLKKLIEDGEYKPQGKKK